MVKGFPNCFRPFSPIHVDQKIASPHAALHHLLSSAALLTHQLFSSSGSQATFSLPNAHHYRCTSDILEMRGAPRSGQLQTPGAEHVDLMAKEGEVHHRAAPLLRRPQHGRCAPALRGGTLINSDVATTTTDIVHGSGDGLHLHPGAGVVHQKVLPLGKPCPGGRT
jgi:hypothetical protein